MLLSLSSGEEVGQVPSLPRLLQFASRKVIMRLLILRRVFYVKILFHNCTCLQTKLNWCRGHVPYCVLSVFFSKYIFFRSGELKVVSVGEAQKCTKGCKVATKRLTCLQLLMCSSFQMTDKCK